MTSKEYDVVKEYLISGISVRSEIVSDEAKPEMKGRSLVINSSCSSERWGTRTQPYSYTCPLEWNDFLDNFEKIRLQAAELLVKAELDKEAKAPIPFLVPEIHGPNGKKMTPASSCNLGISPTLLGADFIKILGLKRSSESYYQQHGQQLMTIPLYTAWIKFGDYQAETLVAPSEHGVPACILGGDFFQKALAGYEERIIELLMPDHLRTLAGAARCKKKYVLITGKYGEHRSRLDQIKKQLASLGLIGMILDEYPDIEEQSLAEKMVTYASICRFVIVDDFLPSGHINELGICHERKFITAILRLKGRASTAMQSDISEEVGFIKSFVYELSDAFEKAVDLAAQWANTAVEERAKKLNREYSSWRSPERIMK
jgi:hypothetical protein